MLGWSTNLFRIRGIQLAVHASFYLLLAWVAYEGYDPDGWVGVAWNVGTVLAFFTCVVLHELGHSFTAMHFGIGVRRILLMPIGGMAEFESIPRQPGRELLITLAGPAVNFVIASVLWLAVGAPGKWSMDGEFAANATGFAQLLLHWNVIMGCFNLAPVFPMDGGRILRALLAARLPYLRATFIAATVGKVLAVAGALTAFFVFDLPLTAVLFAFIFFAGEMEYRAAQRREWEDAYWRDLTASLTAAPPPAEVPPILRR
jgi:Zn-dependent protease